MIMWLCWPNAPLVLHTWALREYLRNAIANFIHNYSLTISFIKSQKVLGWVIKLNSTATSSNLGVLY